MDPLIQSTAYSSSYIPNSQEAFSLGEHLKLLSRSKYDVEKMIPIINDMLFSKPLAIEQFPRAENGYSRTILYREPCGFEVMAARWSKLAKSPVHGHPGFAMVYLVEGHLWEDSFSRNADQLIPTGTRQFSNGDYAFDDGVDGRFDNSIHQITAITECLSLHIYSDDALKGEIYSV